MGFHSEQLIKQQENEIKAERMGRIREAKAQTKATGHYVSEYDIEVQEEWERVKDK